MSVRKTTPKSKKTKTLRLQKVIALSTPIRRTRVFQSGNSRAVRLPKEIHLNLGPVNIYQIGDNIVICKTQITLGDIWKSAPELPTNFTLERPKDDVPQERDFQWD
jgi:antitoxin VapB